MRSIRRLAFAFAVYFFSSAKASCVAITFVALMFSPRSATSQNGFSLSADLNGVAGDQGVTVVDVSPEETVSIQVFANGVSGAQGVSIRFVYDGGQVAYEGTDVGDLFPNAQVLAEEATDPTSVTLGIAAMGGHAASSSGLAATARFRTSAAFTATTIRIVEAVLGRGGERDTLMTDVNAVLRPVDAGPSPDFDGDGTVGFGDFLQLAGRLWISGG